MTFEDDDPEAAYKLINYRYAYWKLTLIFAPFLALLIFVAFVLQ